MSALSTEEDYNKLPLRKLKLRTTSFEKFGYAEKDDIDELCKKKGLTFNEKVAIRRVWQDHPKRQTTTSSQPQGK